MITVSAFRWVPPFAQGQVRDLRVRWALEEAGLKYEEMLIGPDDQKSPQYRKLQPFGQVPAYIEDGIELWETGAIVHHIALKTDVLSPPDAVARARMLSWMFSALNSIEPRVMVIGHIDAFAANEEWAKVRRPKAVEELKPRLQALADALGEREYLMDRFNAADLLMSTVLRILQKTDIVSSIPKLQAYVERCIARPAFTRALDAQLAAFARNTPPPQTPKSA